jgi:hypothetical protein
MDTPKTKPTIVGGWSTFTRWIPARPSGIFGFEQHTHTVILESADYFGTGPRVYAKGNYTRRDRVSMDHRPQHGYTDMGWSDGHQARIAERAASVGAIVPTV